MAYKFEELKDFSPASLKILNDNIRMLKLKVFGSMDFVDLGENLSSENFEITKEHARFYGKDGSYSEFVPDTLGMRWHKEGGIRYIRNYLGGNTVDSSNRWVEIEALDSSGTNIALGKPVTMSSEVASGSLSMVTDGDKTSSNYVSSLGTGSEDPVYVQVDLGAAYDITNIKIWHYYTDYRKFYRNITEVSADGETWSTLFSSDYEGEITESADGQPLIMDLSENYSFLKVTGFVNLVGINENPTIQLPDAFKGQNFRVMIGINYAGCHPASGHPTAISSMSAEVVDMFNDTIQQQDRELGQFRIIASMLCVDLTDNSEISSVVSPDDIGFSVNFMAIC